MAKEEIESSKPEEVKKLELEIHKLRKKLAYEKMKADVYDTMIDVAEEMFQNPTRNSPKTECGERI